MIRRRLITITPEQLALLQLKDAASDLAKAPTDPQRLLQAAKSLHAGMVAALTAALAGSSGTGAYVDKVKERWTRLLESEREPFVQVDLPQRVLSATDLIDRACTSDIEWTSRPLTCTPEDRDLIDRLTFIRDALEHPKPMLHSFEAAWVAQTLAPAARLVQQALEAVAHHLDQPDLISPLIREIVMGAGMWLSDKGV